ncbi:MAG TPA: MATE family efflux transporter [Steroidobacteraceae bacterium]|jgi:MATE family multidrug resistance protein|nr:MATE family efflux transporter [Steroidobacteraceae bacterium]
MDFPQQSARAAAPLPAQRIDVCGRAHVDQRAVLALALPLMANSAVQIVLNLTDMWFMGRISTKALAAVGAVQWLIIAVVLVLGGAGMAVQTLVAQNFGARRYTRAGQAVWTALWAMALAAPLFVLVGAARHLILAPFGFDRGIEQLAAAFWFPRMGGAFVGAAVWAMFGFFNGVGRPRVTLLITLLTTGANAVLNQLFIFGLGWGIAGSAWATNVAQLLGLSFAITLFLRSPYRRRYHSHLTWRPHAARLLQQLRLGVPMGLSPAADLLGFAIFQMMQTRLGTAGGAATQMVVMLTSLAYMPGFGIAAAGTTLVGQSIGAGARAWAQRVGNRVILLAALYMGGIGLLIALCGPWLLPFFAGAHDADSAAAVALGMRLLWLAAAYQFFDGLNLGSSLCLRGAADVRVPALLVLALALLLLAPLAHALTFAPGQGWVSFLPQFGFGPVGGWVAVLVYVIVLGSALFLRWRSGAWQAIRI